VVLNSSLIVLLVGLSGAWYFFYADREEIEVMFKQLVTSYMLLIIGFCFWASRFPEKYLSKERVGEGINKVV
jgi:hypothetical protein